MCSRSLTFWTEVSFEKSEFERICVSKKTRSDSIHSKKNQTWHNRSAFWKRTILKMKEIKSARFWKKKCDVLSEFPNYLAVSELKNDFDSNADF